MNKKQLRAAAVSRTLFPQTSLKEAADRLGFVQVDPIRAPARAQDLILRHRVKDYRLGEMDKSYQELGFEEDNLYALGYLRKDLSELWYPNEVRDLTDYDRQVLEKVGELGQVSSKELTRQLGDKKIRNWWGRQSQAAKHSLDILNYWGLVRVVSREGGVKIYEKREQEDQKLPLMERKKQLVLAVMNLLSPVTEKRLNEALHYVRYQLGETKAAIEELVNQGQIDRVTVEGVKYLVLAEGEAGWEIDQKVKILAPFDPMVWDRRIRGYYAMPVLWQDKVIGWANAVKSEQGTEVELGFVEGRPKSKVFERELSWEIESLNETINLIFY